MKVDITKFWIEGVLLEHYPQFHQNQGADLDENGAIEGSEVFYDLDGNGTVGNRNDYKRYLELNRDLLSAQIPFFKWGEKLSVDNRIHQLMYLESDLVINGAVESAYLFLSKMVDDVNKRIDDRKLSSIKESQLYYNVMENEGEIVFGGQDDHSFISNLIYHVNLLHRVLACDTSSFLAMAIGDERGLILQFVIIPGHTFLRGKNESGYEFNIDQGFIMYDYNYFPHPIAGYSADQELIAKSGYRNTLNNQQLEARLFLANRGHILLNLGRYEEALAAYDRSLEIEPNNANVHFNRGVALKELGRYEEAVAVFNRIIKMYPDDPNALHNRRIVLMELGYATGAATGAASALTSQSK